MNREREEIIFKLFKFVVPGIPGRRLCSRSWLPKLFWLRYTVTRQAAIYQYVSSNSCLTKSHSFSGKGLGSQDKQMTLQTCLDLRKPLKADSPEALGITRKIAEMMAVDNQPVAMVEDTGFRRVLHFLKPTYTLPSRRFFMDTELPKIQAKVMEKVNAYIQDAEALSFTTDCWTNISNKAFMSFTAHGIGSDFERFTFVLAARPFDVSHTAANIREMLIQVSQYNIIYKLQFTFYLEFWLFLLIFFIYY